MIKDIKNTNNFRKTADDCGLADTECPPDCDGKSVSKAFVIRNGFDGCQCKECDCAKNKIPEEEDLGSLFERYQVWKSKTPGELVDELARKMVDIRCTRAYCDEESEYGYGGVGPLD